MNTFYTFVVILICVPVFLKAVNSLVNKTVTTVTAIKAAQNCLSLKAVILLIDKITV